MPRFIGGFCCALMLIGWISVLIFLFNRAFLSPYAIYAVDRTPFSHWWVAGLIVYVATTCGLVATVKGEGE